MTKAFECMILPLVELTSQSRICFVWIIIYLSCSLRKEFFRSQAQRAGTTGNRQILEARKKWHRPELFFCQSIGSLEILIWLICQRRLLRWHPFCLWLKGSAYLPLFTFKERNSGLFCPIFLTFDNFTTYKPSPACDPEILPTRSELYRSRTLGLYYLLKTGPVVDKKL